MNPKRESNPYDKIFKENAESIFLPLIAQKLGIAIDHFKPIKEKFQTTIEREMDLFYEVQSLVGQSFMLHVEFQSTHDKQMIYRMAEYHGIAYRKRKIPIKHLLIYLGTQKINIKSKLDENEIFTGFEVLNLYDIDTNELLKSQVPEVILLAVLSNYSKEQSEDILRSLIERLKKVSKSNLDLSKFMKQLLILSRLRHLDDITYKISTDMPITIEIEKDYLYNLGIEKGIEKGLEKGAINEQEKVVIKAFNNGISLPIIANITNLSLKKVKDILKNNNLLV